MAGYLATNILDTGKIFYVGNENVLTFFNYVLDECEGYELIYHDILLLDVEMPEIYTKFNEIVGDKTAIYISHRLSIWKL